MAVIKRLKNENSITKAIDARMKKAINRFILAASMLMLALPATAQEKSLLLFGGKDHKMFLGCLNCNRYDEASVWNPYGKFGSIYSSDSVWNRYGTWGSQFNSESPWNKFSNEAPVIVDKDGGFYGYFSSNKFHDKRTRISWLVWLLDNYDYVIDHLD